MYQVGTKIGINEPSPAYMLDVNGAGQIRGTLVLPALATATTTTAQPSEVMQWSASAWSSTAAAAISPTFNLFIEPVNNNTASASGQFRLGYQLGTSHTTDLSLTGTGALTSYGGFAAEPSSAATSSAAANSPLLELGASAYSSGSSSAVAQNFAWQVLPTGNDTATPSSNLALLYSTGTATPAATGLSISPKGLINWATGQTFPITGTGGGTITGITTTSPLTGSGTSGSVALGLNTGLLLPAITPPLETTFNGVYARLGAADVFSSYIQASQTAGPSNAAVLGAGTSGSIGVDGSSDTGNGVQGSSISGHGVFADVTTPAVGSSGVLGFTGTAFSTTYSTEAAIADAGVWADNSAAGTGTPVALFATGDDTFGGAIVTNGATYPALFVQNNTGVGAQINAAATGDALDTTATSAGNGVYGLSLTPGEQNAGVLGVATSASVTGGSYNIYSGVWGDTGTSSTTVAPAWAIGVLGTADDGHAGVFLNNSSGWSTLYISNASTGGTGEGSFKTLMASSADGTCGIGGGSLTCTGPIKSLASAGNGARTVETYGVQSPENWMEDFGSGELKLGVAVVKIDPAFAETVTADASYHVFITPNGDSEALYVINKTATSFEVRESKGGTSSLTFDYRIVAKRRGYKAQRLVDVTESYNAEMKAATMARGSGAVRKPSAMAKSPLQAALSSHPRRLAPARSPVPHKPMGQPANPPTHP